MFDAAIANVNETQYSMKERLVNKLLFFVAFSQFFIFVIDPR